VVKPIWQEWITKNGADGQAMLDAVVAACK
jgi:hypothetical protein